MIQPASAAVSSNCFTYADFASTSGLVLLGDAATTNATLRLTRAVTGLLGTAWYGSKQYCAGGFDTTFKFQISALGSFPGSESGGDGISFNFQNIDLATQAPEFGILSNSITISLNTFNNIGYEPSGNWVGVASNAQWLVQRDLNPTGINLSDGNQHTAQVKFNGANITVIIDGLTVITNLPVNATKAMDAGGNAWVGFGARTGNAWENHDILNWSFCAGASSAVPPVITTQPTNKTATVGDIVTFNVAATGDAPLRYQWRFGIDNLAGQTNALLTLANVQSSNAGLYSVLITNSAGSTTSSNALLTVKIPDLTNCFAYVDFTTTNGLALIGSAFVTNGVLRLTPATASQIGDTWLRGKQPCSNGFDTSFRFRITQLGNVLGNEPGGDGFTFAVQNLSETNLSWALGDTNNFVAVFFNTFWNWPGCTNCPDVSGNSVGILVNQNYVVQADLNPLGIDMSDGAVHQARIVFNGAGLSVMVDGRSVLANVSLPGLVPGTDVYGRSWVGFTAGTGAAYENHDILDWSFCAGASSAVPPVVTTQPTNQTATLGDTVTFSVAATGDAPLRYQWRFGIDNLPGQTNALLTLANVQSSNAGLYSVLITNSAGSTTSSNALLTVLPPPVCTPAPAGIVSWWRAESNGLDSVDGNNAFLTNVTFAAGKVGQAFNLNGSNSFARAAASSNLNVGAGDGFTIESWIKPKDLIHSLPIAEWNRQATGTPTYGSHFWLMFRDPFTGANYPGSFFANIVDTANNWHIIASDAGMIQTNDFQHVAVTYHKASGLARLYLNGVAVKQLNLGTFTPQTSYNLFLGHRPPGVDSTGTFLGLVDEVLLYNRALTTNEIAAQYAAGSTGNCQTPPIIITQPVSQKVTVGSNVTFTAAAEGTPQLRYQWRFNTTNISGATGTQHSFVVASDSSGLYSVRVTNAFGAVTSTNAVLTVNFVPVAQSNSVRTLEDTSLPVTLTGSDANGDALAYAIVTPPAHGTLSGSGTNRIYKPGANYHGPDSFTFQVNDGLVDSAPATVNIVVTPVNDTPMAYSQSVTLDEDTTASITLIASDADNDALAYSVGSPAHGSLTGTPPNLVYHPNTNYSGSDSFTFSVNDGATNSNVATVSITVRPVNDAPVARITVSPLTQLLGITNNLVIARTGASARVILDASQSSDADNDPLTYAWSEGTNSLGSAVIVTNQSAVGTHEITLVVSDGQLTGSAGTTVEVVTPAQAIAIIVAYLGDISGNTRKDQPLFASLRVAAASFDRSNVSSGVNQLQAFQNKVRVQIAPGDAELAAKLTEAAQQIINVVTGD